MIEIHTINDWKLTEDTEESKRYTLDFSKAKVQVFKFKKGYEAPSHMHKGRALHIITKGKIQLNSGEIIESFADYACGAWEYRFTALEDTEIILVEET